MRIQAPTSASARPDVREVQARRTPASLSDIRGALSRALEAATGQRAHTGTVDVLAAQVSLETARGGQMFNFNFGGIKGASPRGETANYMTREVLDGQSVHLQQGFRAYSSLDEGAKDYVSVLRTRFPAAFAQAVAGNVDGFAHALKQSHYYTAPEQEYATGLRGAVGLPTTSPRVEPLQAVPQGFSTSAELSRILDAVSASATRIAAPEPLD